MTDCPFKSGDKVTIFHYREPFAFAEVTKITKSPKAVHLSDGSKWNLSGFGRHGGNDWGRRIEITKPEDVTEHRRRMSLCRVLGAGRYEWDELSDGELNEVVSMLDRGEERRRAKQT